jgi:serine/threonine-protein kinase ULK/ATG1
VIKRYEALLFILKKMPKLIDNYVLSRKIGAGQYGEVFKGYDRATNNDIAVKSIRRENVKGKLSAIQESLRSCWRVK